MKLLRQMFEAAVAAAQPAACLPPHLPGPPKGRTIVVGAGKAAAAMAQAVERHYPATVSGLVVTREGHSLPTDDIEVVEASHPVPDARGEVAARRILDLVSGAGADDLVLCLLSGGGSALLPLPAPGLTLEYKRQVTDALVKSGATISEINTVRRHLSAIKGGRLAEAAKPARLLTLAISDVPGDDPVAIASGPTVPDPTTFADARDVLRRYEIDASPAVSRHLETGVDAPGDPWGDYVLIARPADALAAAAGVAMDAGYEPVVLGDAIEGEASGVALEHAALAREHAGHGKKVALISGGELTVTVTGNGSGGPNHEYVLALMLALGRDAQISALACDTDGMDGSTGVAGAWFTGNPAMDDVLVDRMETVLRDHDSGRFFRELDQQVVSGPTQTNVNDFRVILVDPSP